MTPGAATPAQEQQHAGVQGFQLLPSSGPPWPTPLPSITQGALSRPAGYRSMGGKEHLSLQG